MNIFERYINDDDYISIDYDEDTSIYYVYKNNKLLTYMDAGSLIEWLAKRVVDDWS